MLNVGSFLYCMQRLNYRCILTARAHSTIGEAASSMQVFPYRIVLARREITTARALSKIVLWRWTKNVESWIFQGMILDGSWLWIHKVSRGTWWAFYVLAQNSRWPTYIFHFGLLCRKLTRCLWRLYRFWFRNHQGSFPEKFSFLHFLSRLKLMLLGY